MASFFLFWSCEQPDIQADDINTQQQLSDINYNVPNINVDGTMEMPTLPDDLETRGACTSDYQRCCVNQQRFMKYPILSIFWWGYFEGNFCGFPYPYWNNGNFYFQVFETYFIVGCDLMKIYRKDANDEIILSTAEVFPLYRVCDVQMTGDYELGFLDSEGQVIFSVDTE